MFFAVQLPSPPTIRIGRLLTWLLAAALGSCPAVSRASDNAAGEPPSGAGVRSERTVLFAGGTVEFEAPHAWTLKEVPRGRLVRLELSPPGAPPQSGRMRDGISMAYHANSVTSEDDSLQLVQQLPSRIGQSHSAARLTGELRLLELRRWTALQQDFSVPDESPALRGRYVVCRTDWGLFELEAVAAAESFPARTATLTALVKSLVFHPPVRASWESLGADVRDAAGILGSWKAYRSRLRLTGDGRIRILPDAPQELTADGTPSERLPALVGTFHASGDLLFVVWQDGSQLNFRWMHEENSLFLTDHFGQVSLLRRMYE